MSLLLCLLRLLGTNHCMTYSFQHSILFLPWKVAKKYISIYNNSVEEYIWEGTAAPPKRFNPWLLCAICLLKTPWISPISRGFKLATFCCKVLRLASSVLSCKCACVSEVEVTGLERRVDRKVEQNGNKLFFFSSSKWVQQLSHDCSNVFTAICLSSLMWLERPGWINPSHPFLLPSNTAIALTDIMNDVENMPVT